MSDVLRTILLILMAGAAVTFVAIFVTWWFEPARRMRRALRRVLGAPPDCEALSPAEGRAAGLTVASRTLAVLWNNGGAGLAYGFQEIEGAELIVDGRVTARARRDEPRRLLDDIPAHAERVALRLVFSDPRFPEFELELFGPGALLSDGAEAGRLGRRWLSHIETVLRQPRPVTPPPLELESDDGL